MQLKGSDVIIKSIISRCYNLQLLDNWSMENFNNRVWLTSYVKDSLADLSATMRFADPLTWIPSWGFDRLLCLYIQAKYFNKYDYIGHQVLGNEQVRYIGRPYTLKSIRLCIRYLPLIN